MRVSTTASLAFLHHPVSTVSLRAAEWEHPAWTCQSVVHPAGFGVPCDSILPHIQKNFSCSHFLSRDREMKAEKKKPSIFLFLNKTILKFSRLLKTSDNYLEEKVIITSQRDGPKPFCCNCMVGKSVLFTSGGSSIYLQPDRIWIPNLVTYQMMTHHFIQTFYGREKHV